MTRAAIESELTGNAASAWLAQIATLPSLEIEHRDVVDAVSTARDELAGASSMPSTWSWPPTRRRR